MQSTLCGRWQPPGTNSKDVNEHQTRYDILLQDMIWWEDLESDWLDILRAISVDTIHLETRACADIAGHELNINEGPVFPKPFAQAREKVETKGMKLYNVFYSCPREIPLGLNGAGS